MSQSIKFMLVLVLSLVFQGCQSMSTLRSSSADEIPESDLPVGFYSGKANQNILVDPYSQSVKTSGDPKKRVVVLNFWNASPVKLDFLGPFAADELRRGLAISQRVIFPTDAKTETTTEDYIQGDQVKVGQLVREGRRLGVAVIVIGRVSKIVFRQKGDDVGIFRKKEALAAVEVEYKVFDVQSGREILADSRFGEVVGTSLVVFEDSKIQDPTYRADLIKGALRESIARIIPDVLIAVDKLSWQGRIARVQSDKIFINAGKTTGIMPGDILLVQTQGDDIYDPQSGIYLGQAKGHSKGTLEVVDFLGTDGAIGKIQSGGNFKEGDLVQLY